MSNSLHDIDRITEVSDRTSNGQSLTEEQRRTLLFSARMRLSTHTQTIRDRAIDEIVKQTLAGATSPVNEHQLLSFLSKGIRGGIPAVGLADLRRSLARLLEQKQVELVSGGPMMRYELTAQAAAEMAVVLQRTDRNIDRVVDRLFPGRRGKTNPFRDPFLYCLSYVFSELGSRYVLMILGTLPREEVHTSGILKKALTSTKKRYSRIDENLFANAITKFFNEEDLDYNEIKWNLAQNYYVAAALGLDRAGRLLSTEVLSGAILYLDTNVLIHALDPTSPYNAGFLVLSQLCKELGAELRICRISLEEMTRVVESYCELVQRIVDRVPDEIAAQVPSIFFQRYRDNLKSETPVAPEELFKDLLNAEGVVRDQYGIAVVDDPWFDRAGETRNVQRFAGAVITAAKTRPRKYDKRQLVVLHDALMLAWVSSERERMDRDVWFVTLDNSLPQIASSEETGRSEQPLALSLAALLQWVSPLALGEDEDTDVSAVFAEAIRLELLPKDRIYNLMELRVLADLDIDCRQLPAEDVDGCIQIIKSHGLKMDLSEPSSLLTLSHELATYFADPSRKFQKELQRLKDVSAQKDDLLEDKNDELKAKDTLLSSKDKELENKDFEIKDLRQQLEILAQKPVPIWRKKWPDGAVYLLTGLLFVTLQVLALGLGMKSWTGVASIDYIKDQWWLHAVAFALWVFLGGLVLEQNGIFAKSPRLGSAFESMRSWVKINVLKKPGE